MLKNDKLELSLDETVLTKPGSTQRATRTYGQVLNLCSTESGRTAAAYTLKTPLHIKVQPYRSKLGFRLEKRMWKSRKGGQVLALQLIGGNGETKE